MFKQLLGNADRLVVLDVETTGLYNADRVVEVGLVTLDRSGDVIDEWDTLIDPRRDVGPVHLHGVTASMVSAAPTFDEVAGVVARRLDGAVLVAHNLPFDTRMLNNEFTRTRADFSPGAGVCTMRLGSGKLGDLCRQYGIDHGHAHRALADARATAELLRRIAPNELPTRPAIAGCPHAPAAARSLRREHVQGEAAPPMPYLARLASQLHHFTENAATLAYLDLLDWALADLAIDPAEAAELHQLALDLGLTPDQVRGAHARYLDELLAAAMRDGVVTDQEQALLSRAAVALGVDPGIVDQQVKDFRPQTSTVSLEPGLRVCFTGTAVHPDGSELPRARLESIARSWGLEPVAGATKKGCDLVVAADPLSRSGKATKARQYGIPITSVAEFLRCESGSTVPAL